MRRSWTLSVAVLLVACTGHKNDDPDDTDAGSCAGETWYPDRDDDGYGADSPGEARCAASPGWVTQTGDCDDTNAAIHPGVPEAVDGVDEDCDGAIDDGTPGADDDGDGYCEDPTGCTDGSLPGDCDDSSAVNAPNAEELCDGIDNNCDGVGDIDADGDGELGCADCDDDDDTRAASLPELCDGIDNNCDQVIDNRDEDGDGWVSCPSSGGQLDLIVVIDDSSSMADEQVLLGATSGAFFDQLTSGRIDWQIAVITSSSSAQVGATLTPRTATARADFQNAVAVGATGSNDERPFQTLVAFLGAKTWRRPGASLAVWVLSDEDDFSAVSVDEVARVMRVGVPDSKVLFSSISGGWAGCDDSSTGRRGTPASRIAALVALTHGAFSPICAADWFGTWQDAWIPDRELDCDDADANVFPGALERCNGQDDNCDGRADEDADGDGLAACVDCDDRDARKGGPEICDGVDNDCDGVVPADERDGDRDGYLTCEDCDDADPLSHPHAVENCSTLIDEDCDGHAQHDAHNDADMDGDGYSRCGGDCDDEDATRLPNAPEHRFNRVDDDCDGLIDGRDPDLIYPLNLAPNTVRTTYSGGASWLRVCGTDFSSVTLSADGWIAPGSVSISDAVPSVPSLRAHAPFVAATWANLTTTGWTDGPFLSDYGSPAPMIFVKREHSISVVWNNMAVVGGGAVTTLATLGGDAIDLAVFEADAPDSTLIGWACDGTEWSPVSTNGGAPLCLDTTHHRAGSFTLEDFDATPFSASSACTP